MTEMTQKFNGFSQWVNMARSWLTRRLPEERAICFDDNLKIIRNGKDFQEAKFPVRWIWPTQLIEAVEGTELIWEIEALEEETVNFLNLPDLLDACQKRTLRYIIGSKRVGDYIRKNIDINF